MTLLDEATYDADLVGGIVNIDFDPKNEIGANFAAAAGASIPLANLKLRLEGEVAIRGNAIEEIEDVNGAEFDTINSSAISALSGMANAHLDFYVTQSVALSAGAGVGYAKVKADIAAEVNGANIGFIDNESDNVLAYQLMTGVRYDFGASTVSLGYRYFTTDDPEFEVDGSGGTNDYKTEYATHNVNFGYAYNF